MANVASTIIYEDGPRSTVLRFDVVLDSSDLAPTVVVNLASQYRDPVGDTIGTYRVDKIEYEIDDPLTVQLYWGGVPTLFTNLSGRGRLNPGLRYGGLQNNESTLVRDGRILATTTGYVAASVVAFTLEMWLVKQAFIGTPAAFDRITGDGDLRITGDGDQRIVYA